MKSSDWFANTVLKNVIAVNSYWLKIILKRSTIYCILHVIVTDFRDEEKKGDA